MTRAERLHRIRRALRLCRGCKETAWHLAHMTPGSTSAAGFAPQEGTTK